MAATKRFSYYDRLSAAQKATYRKSDEVRTVAIPDVDALRALATELEVALETGKRALVARAATAVCDALFRQLGVPPARVRVREVRPEIDGGELHGLYTYAGDASATPTIEVWMRTLAHERVVRFRTFLRTLVHEVLHHLDVTLLSLDESFHTEGFFRRESSLVRQLVPSAERTPREKRAEAPPPRKGTQLALFDKR